MVSINTSRMRCVLGENERSWRVIKQISRVIIGSDNSRNLNSCIGPAFAANAGKTEILPPKLNMAYKEVVLEA